MNLALLIFGILILGSLAVLLLLQLRRSDGAESDTVLKLRGELTKLQSEKDELSGKGKQLYDSFKNLEVELKITRQDRDLLQKQVQKSDAERDRREKESDEKLSKLDAAKESLERERQRVVREDEEKRMKQEEERDRIWADHEKNVIASLTELCKEPQYAFTCYTNTNLPQEFDGSLKPDFMIEFLDQYVIFDAKKSKSESLQTYINNTVKKTVSKVKNNDHIAPFIYLVVPTEAIGELRTYHYVLDGFTLYVVSPEALAPILAALKKITTYEFAEQMDPQQRENIVQLIAELDFHINLRNAADILLTKMGTDILEKTQKTDPLLAEEVALKKQPMNAKAMLAGSDIKKLIANLTAQNLEVQKLVSPKTPVKEKVLRAAQSLLGDTLS